LFYFRGKNESDFIMLENGKIKELIQVCYELNDLNFSREYNGLNEAMDFFNTSDGTIITFNYMDKFEKDGKSINVVPAF